MVLRPGLPEDEPVTPPQNTPLLPLPERAPTACLATVKIPPKLEALDAVAHGVDLSSTEYDQKLLEQYVERSKTLSREGTGKLSKNFYTKVFEPWYLQQINQVEEPEEPTNPNPSGGDPEDGEDQDDPTEGDPTDGECGYPNPNPKGKEKPEDKEDGEEEDEDSDEDTDDI